MIAEYPWLDLTGIRKAVKGDHCIGAFGQIFTWDTEESGTHFPIVKPSNAYSVLRLEDLKIPEGHEPDGESLKEAFRDARGAKCYLSTGLPGYAAIDGTPAGPDFRRLCLRKIAPKTKRVLVVEWDITEAASRDQVACIEAWLRHPGPFDTSRVEDRPL